MPIQEIEVSFERIKGLTLELLQTADGLQKLTQEKGTETLSQINKAWSGENAVSFAQKERAQIDRLLQSARVIRGISDEILEKARRIYEAEKWNWMVANSRSYR